MLQNSISEQHPDALSNIHNDDIHNDTIDIPFVIHNAFKSVKENTDNDNQIDAMPSSEKTQNALNNTQTCIPYLMSNIATRKAMEREKTKSERIKEYMKNKNQSVRNRRRIQFTMLNFLYAYEKKYSLQMTRMQVRKRCYNQGELYNFYRVYSFVAENGDVYEPKQITYCGKDIMSKSLGNYELSDNSTLAEINSINYYTISMLNIDLTKYKMKKKFGRCLKTMEYIPFIDLDMRLYLFDVWKVDYDLFYQNINSLIDSVLKSKETNIQYITTGKLTIPFQSIKQAIVDSVIEENESGINVADNTVDKKLDVMIKLEKD